MKRDLRLSAGLGLFVGLLVAAQHRAFASPLELIVTEGPTSYDIIDNGPLDTNPAVGSIDALTAALVFPDYTFTTLGASSNSPGSPSGGTLSLTGQVQLLPGGTGSVQVFATDTDYTLPSGTSDALLGSTSSTFTAAPAGNSQAFTSYFNPSNTPGAKEVASPTVTLVSTGTLPNSEGGSSAAVAVTGVIPYGLSNLEDITLSDGAAGAASQLQFAGTTAITPAGVPAPVSAWAGLLLVTGLGAWRLMCKRSAI
jgi:hypothetical protein